MSTSTYPVQVSAELDSQLSRWQWLVKWLLALPHYRALPHYLVLVGVWVMNADGSAGLDTDVAAGVEVPAVDWLVPVLLSVAGTGLLVALVVLAVSLQGTSSR